MKVNCHGFTLLELLVAVSIFVFLIMLAGPMYGQFMANSQIRNASEAMLNGVREAQTTAIKGNTPARLVVDPTAGTGGWRILTTVDGAEPASNPTGPCVAPSGAYSINPVRLFCVADGAPNATVTTTPAGATQITFDGFGRVVANADATATISCINVTNSNVSGTRDLRVVVSNTGIGIGTKLCDPAVASTEPQGCPATPCT
jgi:type IV fimbrial biogenesis protein FimT